MQIRRRRTGRPRVLRKLMERSPGSMTIAQAQEIAQAALVELDQVRTGVDMYMSIVEGLLAMRSVGPLSQATEAEIAEIQDNVWRKLSEYEKGLLDGDDGLIERAKRRWKDGVHGES